ncbi:MAG: hypothetical protein S4CHLAM81_06830 [Chlamydiales bacterium]|nr:hypothetical protein [Chlamydiales bacterium]MCH9635467.1 hypothetical protein [Chlamydiales bacterium]
MASPFVHCARIKRTLSDQGLTITSQEREERGFQVRVTMIALGALKGELPPTPGALLTHYPDDSKLELVMPGKKAGEFVEAVRKQFPCRNVTLIAVKEQEITFTVSIGHKIKTRAVEIPTKEIARQIFGGSPSALAATRDRTRGVVYFTYKSEGEAAHFA